MSHDETIHWRACAEEARTRAEQMLGDISKHMMYRIAEDYDLLARTVAQRPNRFLITPVVPAEVQRYAPCKHSFAASVAVDLENPEFFEAGTRDGG